MKKMAQTKGGREFHAYKLFAPPLRLDVIQRDAILDRILPDTLFRAIIMQAPAGYGKTTTLLQVKAACEAHGFLTAWLTLDEADNDTRRFLIHFEAFLASLGGGVAEARPGNAIEFDDVAPFYKTDWVIDRLLGLGKPVTLFLDDFQVLEAPRILAFFRDLLARLPQSARLVIGSRSVPEIGLARLLVNRQAIVLRPEELCFSPEEAREFFATAATKGVTAADVDLIWDLTEGWPAALQLYRLSSITPTVRNSLGDFSASRPRELAEYLAENVLSMQPPDIQEFLLRTSLLSRLTAPLCEAVTGRADSRDILLSLERSGLFLRSLDAEARWFEYHALFASFLREHMQTRPGSEALSVHSNAARWHLQNTHYEEAVRHAIACEDFAFAADAMDRWSSQLVAGAFLITMERWCDRFPFEEIASRPSLLIKNAWALAFLKRYDKLKPLLSAIKQLQLPFDINKTTDPTIVLAMAAIVRDDVVTAFRIIDSVSVRDKDVTAFAAFQFAAASNLRAFRQLSLGDFEGARRWLSVARVQGERGEATFSRGYTEAIGGISLMVQGHLGDALDRLKAAMAEQRMHVDRSVAAASLAPCYIWALYEANELEAAEALSGQYHDLISDSTLLDFLAVAQISLARIHDIRGRYSQALAVLEEGESIAHANDWPRYLRILAWERVRRALLAGSFQRAEAIASAMATPEVAGSQEWLMFTEDLEGEGLGRIRLAIYGDRFDIAKEGLQREFSRQRGRVLRQVKLHLLDAQMHCRNGFRNAAQRSLRRALQLAESGRFVRCFLDEGPVVLELLMEEYQSLLDGNHQDAPRGQGSTFVALVLRASGADPIHPAAPTVLTVVELTSHERTVMTLLANGVSNKEMATRLFVSENTVKFHLKNIYAKLSASNRVHAIAVARRLGIVK